MSWYNDNSNRDADVILSTRARYARNISGYPFADKLGEAAARELIAKVRAAAGGSFTEIDFTKLSPTAAASYAELHYVSPEFASADGPRTLLLDEAHGYAVMVCEEDHLREQCILPGIAVDTALERLNALDRALGKSLPFAYSERLGYLTHCPTNLGTGLRISVMMFLPAITMAGEAGRLSVQLQNLGLTLRGMFGEGSDAQGCLYQISNRETMGISAADTAAKLSSAVGQIARRERELRGGVKGESLERLSDRLSRAAGTAAYARLLSSSEYASLYADIRLGAALGVIRGISYAALDALLFETMPATLAQKVSGSSGELERDRARADAVRRTMKAAQSAE